MIDQKVWFAAQMTSDTVACEECTAEHEHRGARVRGRLELAREHTATSCSRGHPISVVRTGDEPLGMRLH